MPRTSILAAVVLAIHGVAAQAAVLVIGSPTGGDFVFSYSGGLDTTGLTFDGPFSYTSSVTPVGGQLIVGGNTINGDALNSAPFIPSLQPLGSGGFTVADLTSGDRFGVVRTDGTPGLEGSIVVPENYTSGDSFSGSATYQNQSILSLGLIPGVTIYTLPSDDTIEIRIIPEPSTFGLWSLGTGLLCLLRRRKR